MLEYDFLKIAGDHLKVYKNFPLPVVLCDAYFTPQWSNPPAHQLLDHCSKDCLAQLLAEFNRDEILQRLQDFGNCTLTDVPALTGTSLNLSPIFAPQPADANRQDPSPIEGIVVMVLQPQATPTASSMVLASHTISALSSSIREAVESSFLIMDSAHAKANLLGQDWLKESFHVMGLHSYQLLRIAANISHYGKMQSGIDQPNFSAVNLLGRLRDLEEPIGLVCQAMQVPITFQLAPQDLHAKLDLTLFELALYNILHNSLYYTRPGNQIVLSAQKQGDFVLISIADRGLGIPKTAMTDILLPYRSYSHNSLDSGLGLGLAIANQIVRNHQGEFTIKSQPGQGTTVTMSFSTNIFSQTLPFAQGIEPQVLSDRFSSLYTGLSDAALSPHAKSAIDADS